MDDAKPKLVSLPLPKKAGAEPNPDVLRMLAEVTQWAQDNGASGVAIVIESPTSYSSMFTSSSGSVPLVGAVAMLQQRMLLAALQQGA